MTAVENKEIEKIMEELEDGDKESFLMNMPTKPTVDSIIQNEIIHLNTGRSYITRLRCSACQSQITRPMLPFDWLIHSSLILASCHRILFFCRFSAVEKYI